MNIYLTILRNQIIHNKGILKVKVEVNHHTNVCDIKENIPTYLIHFKYFKIYSLQMRKFICGHIVKDMFATILLKT